MARCNHQVGANPAGDDPLRMISKKEECADSPLKESAPRESIPEICTENDQHVQPVIETVNDAPVTEDDSNVGDSLIENHSDSNWDYIVQSKIETRFGQHETLLIKNEGILHDEETRKSNDSIQVTNDDTSTKGSIMESPYVSTVPKEIEIFINRLNTTDVTDDITKVRNSVVQNANVSYFFPDPETGNGAQVIHITDDDTSTKDSLIKNNYDSTARTEIETGFDLHDTLPIIKGDISSEEETRNSDDCIQSTNDDTNIKGSIMESPYVSNVPTEIEIRINQRIPTNITDDVTKVRNTGFTNENSSYFLRDPETEEGSPNIHITDNDKNTKDSFIKALCGSIDPTEIETGFDQHITLQIKNEDILNDEEIRNINENNQSTNDDTNIKASVMESPYVSSVPTEIEIGIDQRIPTNITDDVIHVRNTEVPDENDSYFLPDPETGNGAQVIHINDDDTNTEDSLNKTYDVSIAPTEIETGFDQHDTLQIKSVSTPEIRSFIDHDNDFSISLDVGTGIGEDYTSHVSDQRTNIKIAIVEKYQDSFLRPEKEVRDRDYDISETRNDYTNMQSSIAENGFCDVHRASPETGSDRHQTLPIQVEDTLVDVKSGNNQFEYPKTPFNERSTSFVTRIEDEVFIPYGLFESPTTKGKDVARPRAKIVAEMKNRKYSFLIEQNNIRHLEPSIRSSCTMDLSQYIACYNMDIGYIQSVIARDLNFFYGDRTKHWKYLSQFLNDEYCVLDQAKKEKSDCLASFPFYSAFLKIEAGQSFTVPITIAMSDCPQSRELFDNLRRKERHQTFNACVAIRVYSEDGKVEYYPIYSFDWFFKTMWFHDQPPTSEFGIFGRTEPIRMPNSSWNHQTTHWNQFFIIIYINGKRITLDPRLTGDQLSSVISALKDILN